MKPIDWILTLVIAAAVLLSLLRIRKKHTSGGTCSGNCGSCGRCGK